MLESEKENERDAHQGPRFKYCSRIRADMRFDVSTWYETDVSGTLELMKSFVEGVERQAAESARQYEQHKETAVEECDEGSYLVERFQGLDNQTWASLKTIFEEYFPSLQRRSAFLTLWAMFENELNKLCDRYQNERCLRISASDLAGTGIDQSTRYLEKVAGLDLQKSSSKEWQRIVKMKNLRNVVIHRDGSLRDRDSDQVKSALAYIKETDTLSNQDTEIGVEKGFLSHVLDTFRSYFKLIGDAIKKEQESFSQNPSQSVLPTTIKKGRT